MRARVVGGFGVSGQRLHAGIDLAVPYGAGIAAAADGRVVWADTLPQLGLVVRIAHAGGVESIYGHLARIDVRVGQRVVRGAWIGLGGKTGRVTKSRLYFEVRVRGAAIDPLTVLA